MNNNKLISAVVPLYKCSDLIPELTQRLVKTLSAIDENYEIIYVNDGSPENDWEIVAQLAKENKNIKGINLSRNFGQHYAITAGLGYAQGEWIVVMDGDLQDQPEEITKLYEKATEGYKIVFAKKKEKSYGLIKKASADLFYKTFSYLTETHQDKSIANFGIYHADAIKAVLSMGDSLKYFPTMIKWVGFDQSVVEVVHAERNEGESSYNFKKLFALAFDNIISFSNKPLRIIIKLGFLISSLSSIAGIVIIVRYFKDQVEVSGYTSLIVSLWFLSGIIIALLGLLGIYIGKMFDKVKERPTYIIDKTLNT